MYKRKALKILILSHSSELGGAERSMIDTFTHWSDKGVIEPHFIVRQPLKGMVPELKKRKWGYTSIHYTNWSQRTPSKRAEDIFRNARTNAMAVKDIEKVIDKFMPDMVMTNTIVSPWAALAAYYKGVPHAWFVREYGDIDHQHVIELGRQKMLEDIDTLSDLVITNSKTLSKHVEQYIEQKTQPLYTPFNLDLLDRKSKQKTSFKFTNKNSLKLVVTGRIAPSKGQDQAAAAVGILNKKGYETELVVIGTPAQVEDSHSLLKVIQKYGIEDKVHLVGHQPNPLSIVTQADIGVMASRQEAFGRVTFEYMYLGKAVVGANSGATPELIEDGKSGFLYESGNIGSLTEKLLKYANNRKLVDLHGGSARKKAKNMMSGKYTADKLIDIMNNVIATNKKRPHRPLNFSRKWLDYPLIAQKYIEESGVASLRRIIYQKTRHRLKILYLRATSLSGNKIKNRIRDVTDND